MSAAVQCRGCGQSYKIPDNAEGQIVVCQRCGTQFGVSSDAPLMPPPLTPGEGPETPTILVATPVETPAPAPPSRAPTGAQAPAAPAHAPVQPAAPRAAAPPVRSAPSAAPPAIPPSHSELPPVRGASAAPPAAVATGGAPAELYEFEATEKAARMSRTPLTGWIAAGVIIGLLLTIFGVMKVIRLANPNPSPMQVMDELRPHPNNLARLGKRQSGAGYSFQLPDSFEETVSPPVDGLSPGARSFGWAAKASSREEGAVFRLWIVPQLMNVKDALQKLDHVGTRLEYRAVVSNKSDFKRIGSDMVTVRGLLNGTTPGTTREGVIYIIADQGRTLLIIGMGVGPDAREVQALLDTSVRTIRRTQ